MPLMSYKAGNLIWLIHGYYRAAKSSGDIQVTVAIILYKVDGAPEC
jgi:hypothetical protein